MTDEQRTIQVAITGEEQVGPDRPEPSSDALIGNRYRLQRRIGKGGMGEVMLARDEQVGREVAIKRMRAANPSPRAIARFVREASVQGRLEHPAIVPVHEIGRDGDGLPFFVMKRVTGTPLVKLFEDQTFVLQRVLRALVEVCWCIELAHARGIIHRDLKPDNIMLGDFGEVYVIDWGVAKVVGEEDGDWSDVGSGSGVHATAAGTAIGTPGYMAPEQVRGSADIDARADVYTLGCLLFELLAGEPLHPRGFQGMESALAQHETRPSLRVPERDIPPELDAIVVDACAIDREKRIPTARALGERIERYLDGDRDLVRRRELAREHFDNARKQLDSGDHRQVMREAAAALALDPALAGAAELVGRLMIEPPTQMPQEVEQLIEADDIRDAKLVARAGLGTCIASIAFAQLLWWLAPAGSHAPLWMTGVLVADVFIAAYAAFAKRPVPGVIVVANTVIVIAVARLFSPILIAPGVAALLAMAMAMTPRFSWLSSVWSVGTFMMIGVIAPLVAERAGLVSATMSVDDRGMRFFPAMIGPHETPAFVVSALYAICLIAGACIAGYTMRSRTQAAHRHLHVQAWQLRQLVS
ncbi:MAG: serine/threonine protein kinase [Deltaproteobacteria bacterium]|nr:serine/threonine protein kinase [Deltaproteobacteria bacterium]